MIDIIDRIEDARITVSARARDASDAEVYAVLVDAAKEIERLREKSDDLIIEQCMKIVHEQYEDLVEDMKIDPEKWTPKEYWNGYISCGVDSYVAIRQHFYPIEE
jgi:hypothetical protein